MRGKRICRNCRDIFKVNEGSHRKYCNVCATERRLNRFGLRILLISLFFLIFINSAEAINTISQTRQGMNSLKQIEIDLFYPCFSGLTIIECEPIDQTKINEWILWVTANVESQKRGQIISDLLRGITPFRKLEYKFNDTTNETYREEI